MAVKVDESSCIGCGICVDGCPQEALEISSGVCVVNDALCIDCGICTGECPQDALAL